jgi:class 3 adenylate cyclase
MNSPSPPSVHYEVYTLDGGNRWNLHARYERNERNIAMTDAKTVERNLQIPAKVIRETYYPANNHSEETLLYSGDPVLRSKGPPRVSQGTSQRSRPEAPLVPAAAAGKIVKQKADIAPATPIGMVAKFLLVVGASLTLAGTATGLANSGLESVAGSLAETTQSLILFLTFIVTFVAVALPLSTSLLDFRLWTPSAPRPVRPPSPPPQPKPTRVATGDTADLESLKDEEEALPPATELDEEDDAPAAADLDAAHATVTKPVPSESDYQVFVRFVNTLIAAVRQTRPTLDAYNLFGVDLVMAGAIDLFGQQNDLPTSERRLMLKNAIEAMGVKPATAQAFADKYEDYLGEQRYIPMIIAGRNAMDSFLTDQDGLTDNIGPLFELWNRPQVQSAPASSRVTTVMFTDMVGSTDMTQAQGDNAAQHVVRRHNSIVRNALTQFSGKEIKHTGDGIMASFASAASGVEAAVAIQRAIASYNGQGPEQELHVRIGINAGEPIEEEQDLFGATVQLAARVCARCDTDEILCSNVVKELASGRNLSFTSIGGQELKGFKEPVHLYQVDWRE